MAEKWSLESLSCSLSKYQELEILSIMPDENAVGFIEDWLFVSILHLGVTSLK